MKKGLSITFAVMRIILMLLTSLVSTALFSQVNVLISDKTESTFLIGVDGFQQNSSPLKKMILTGLDTSIHQLTVRIETEGEVLEFKKDLKLNSSGNYSYVINRNFVGKIQLRYRGKKSSLPSDIKKYKLNKLTPWPFEAIALHEKTIPLISPVDSITEETASSLNELKKDTLVQVTSVLDAPSARLEQTDTLKVSQPIIPNTQKQDTRSVQIQKMDEQHLIDTNKFDSLMKDVKLSSYEFNKLKLVKNYLITNPISTDELKSVFEALNYDNSRLQLMAYAVERLTDTENLAVLTDSFDYSLSKEQFKNTYLQ